MFACCSVSPQPELLYFDLPGRGEAIRLAFHVADLKFTDTRIQPNEWPVTQPRTPMGTVPVLRLENAKIGQSVAILTYVGMIGKLMPKDPKSYAKVLEVLNLIEDMFCIFATYQKDIEPLASEGTPEASQKRMQKTDVMMTKLTGLYDGLDARIKEVATISPKRYCWGSLSVADIQVYVLVSMVKNGAVIDCPTDTLDSRKNIMKVYETVAQHPKIVEYYKPAE